LAIFWRYANFFGRIAAFRAIFRLHHQYFFAFRLIFANIAALARLTRIGIRQGTASCLMTPVLWRSGLEKVEPHKPQTTEVSKSDKLSAKSTTFRNNL
jgi:hypothetical protein